jgi:hypothetical protein
MSDECDAGVGHRPRLIQPTHNPCCRPFQHNVRQIPMMLYDPMHSCKLSLRRGYARWGGMLNAKPPCHALGQDSSLRSKVPKLQGRSGTVHGHKVLGYKVQGSRNLPNVEWCAGPRCELATLKAQAPKGKDPSNKLI